jgi:ATP-dependent DNA helicase RecG
MLPRFSSKLADGQQLFVVTPLIEESEEMEQVKSVTQAYTETRERLGPDITIAMLHGKMKPSEKDDIMESFKMGQTQVLVATTVIEVGVDIPAATMMIIHSAQRFGLSQLHQLRGRVGRNDMQSYCFLEIPRKSGESYQRLQAMEEATD